MIQIYLIASLQIPFNCVLPNFDWLVTDTSQTEHRVGEDIGFGIRNLKSFIGEDERGERKGTDDENHVSKHKKRRGIGKKAFNTLKFQKYYIFQ